MRPKFSIPTPINSYSSCKLRAKYLHTYTVTSRAPQFKACSKQTVHNYHPDTNTQQAFNDYGESMTLISSTYTSQSFLVIGISPRNYSPKNSQCTRPRLLQPSRPSSSEVVFTLTTSRSVHVSLPRRSRYIPACKRVHELSIDHNIHPSKE